MYLSCYGDSLRVVGYLIVEYASNARYALRVMCGWIQKKEPCYSAISQNLKRILCEFVYPAL